tara:strand:+ start:1130 stop:1318 length:189 start_codon:yes stop_codon:yes gene_type:complete
MNEENPGDLIVCTLNERTVRAIESAVAYTLEKWAGEGYIDQDALFTIRTRFQAMILEINFDK